MYSGWGRIATSIHPGSHPALFWTVPHPVAVLFENIVRYQLVAFFCFSWLHQTVRLLAVAAPVSELKIADIRRVASFGHRDNMIDRRRKRMRILVREVDRLSADAAHRLRPEYLHPGGFISPTVAGGSV